VIKLWRKFNFLKAGKSISYRCETTDLFIFDKNRLSIHFYRKSEERPSDLHLQERIVSSNLKNEQFELVRNIVRIALKYLK